MNASDLINGIIQVGVAIKDAISKSQNGGSVDWTKALQTIEADPNLSKAVQDFLGSIKGQDFQSALKEVDAKQQKLLNGRKVSDLTGSDLLQYSDLADARLVLATQQLTAALNPSVVEWLLDDALPTLANVAPVVLPLLL